MYAKQGYQQYMPPLRQQQKTSVKIDAISLCISYIYIYVFRIEEKRYENHLQIFMHIFNPKNFPKLPLMNSLCRGLFTFFFVNFMKKKSLQKALITFLFIFPCLGCLSNILLVTIHLISIKFILNTYKQCCGSRFFGRILIRFRIWVEYEQQPDS